MRAIVQQAYGPVQTLQLMERATPTPGEKAVLVRVRAAGVDPGVWHLMTGRPYLVRMMAGFSRPRIPVPGWDVAGVVHAVGRGVTRRKLGDEVFGSCGFAGTGAFAEEACLPEETCELKPTNLSFEEAAALPVSGCTALAAVRDVGKVGAGSRVLVLGAAGGVGHYAVQLAKAFGAEVTGVCSTSKLDFVRSLGADDVIDYTSEGFGGRQWDVIVDTAGRRPLSELRPILAPKGALVVVGGEGGNAWTGGFVERMVATGLGSLVSTQKKLVVLTAVVTAAGLATLKELVEAGKLKPAVTRRFRLEEAVAALEEIEKGHSTGKNVIVVP